MHRKRRTKRGRRRAVRFHPPQSGPWFPRPSTRDDLSPVESGSRNLGIDAVLALLRDPRAHEWKERVGVTTPADGSAKSTTRLLLSRGWVLKTDTARTAKDPNAIRSSLEEQAELARRSTLWHPDKAWFLLRSRDRWWPLALCPLLRTLRSRSGWTERAAGWLRMLELDLAAAHELGVGLDLNPSNFGTAPDDDRLYYLDDEVYPPLSCRDLGEAVVTRIPEERGANPERWYAWGRDVQRTLQRRLAHLDQWIELLDGIRSYPLADALTLQRDALLRGLTSENPLFTRPRHGRLRGRPALTCILSDVHGNLPALEAVLTTSRRLGADSHLSLGDVVGYGPFPRECIERMANLAGAVTVMGNHDQGILRGGLGDGASRQAREAAEWTRGQLGPEHLAWLQGMELEHREGPWLSVHGAPQDPARLLAYVYEMTYRANLAWLRSHGIGCCFYGHTHVPMVYRQLADGRTEKVPPGPIRLFRSDEVLLVNPGSVGQPRDGDPRAAFAIWDRGTDAVTFHRVSYPIQPVVKAIRSAGLPKDLVFRLELGR